MDYSKKTNEELRWIMKDAGEAAMRERQNRSARR